MQHKRIIKNNFKINKKIEVNSSIHYYVVADNKKINGSINIQQSNNTTVNIEIYCFAKNKGEIKINLVNDTSNTSKNLFIDQKIIGIISDESSKIEVTPIMNVNNNSVNAQHSIELGHLDYEKIFYLNLRGFNNNESNKILLESIFGDII